MKNHADGLKHLRQPLGRGLLNGLLAALLSALPVGSSRGQILVGSSGSGSITEYTASGQRVSGFQINGLFGPTAIALDGSGHFFVANYMANRIGEYTTSGATVNAALLPSVSCYGIALDGAGHLFVSDWWGGTVGEYTTSGATVNAPLISGLNDPSGIALDGNGNLLVASSGSGTIGEYTTSVRVLNSSLITGLNDPGTMVLDGAGHLFVVNYGSSPWNNGSVGEYTTDGAVLNAQLITGLNRPMGLALDGQGHILVGNGGSNTVGEYTTAGALVSASFISVASPESISIVPEPSVMTFALFGQVLGLVCRFRWPCTSFTFWTLPQTRTDDQCPLGLHSRRAPPGRTKQ